MRAYSTPVPGTGQIVRLFAELRSNVLDDVDGSLSLATAELGTGVLNPGAEWVDSLIQWGQSQGLRLDRVFERSSLQNVQGKKKYVVWAPEAGGFYIVYSRRGFSGLVRLGVESGQSDVITFSQFAKWLDSLTDSQIFSVDLLRPWDVLKGKGLKPISRAFKLATSERSDLIHLLIYAISIALLSLATPIAAQSLINTVAFGTLMQPLFVLGLALVVALGLSSTLKALEHMLVEFFSRRLFVKTVLDFSERAPQLSQEVYSNRDASRLLNRFLEVVTLEKTISALVFDGLTALLQIGAGLLLLAVYHPLLLAFDVFLIAAILFVVFFLGRGAATSAVIESKKKHKIMAWIQDIGEARSQYKSYRARTHLRTLAEHLASDWLDSRKKHYSIHFRQVAFIFVLQVVAGSVLLVLGGALVIWGQLTLGQLVAAEIVVKTTTTALGELAKLFGKYYDLTASLDKVGEVTDASVFAPSGELLQLTNRGIDLEAEVDGEKIIIAARQYYGPEHASNHTLYVLTDALIGGASRDQTKVKLNGQWLVYLSPENYWNQTLVIEAIESHPGTVSEALGNGAELTESLIYSSLIEVGLGHRVQEGEKLTQVLYRDWTKTFSLEEKMRLALAQVLLIKPNLAVIPVYRYPISTELIETYRKVLLDQKHQATIVSCLSLKQIPDGDYYKCDPESYDLPGAKEVLV